MTTHTQQFRMVEGCWSEHNGCYTAEISQLRISRTPTEFILTLPGEVALFFEFDKADKDASGEDTYGWRFKEPGGKTALIIND